MAESSNFFALLMDIPHDQVYNGVGVYFFAGVAIIDFDEYEALCNRKSIHSHWYPPKTGTSFCS